MRILLSIVLLFFACFFYSCSGCSKSGRLSPSKSNLESDRGNSVKDNVRNGNAVVIKMKKENGVYKIPVRINGIIMDFIFDTGAGIISISDLEATFLYKQGKITKEDIIGSEKFQDATGTISDGAIINLKEVSIGNRTLYNVRASVTDNINAPLLLGQSALEKFGKITIDYANEEVIFE
jgi:aspartyl protease family protein